MGMPFLYQDFHGGLNLKDAPTLLVDNEARDLSNVQGTTAGAVVKRNGLNTFASPASALTSLAPLESVGPFLVGAGGTSLYSIATGGVVASIKTGLTNNLRWEFVSAPVVSSQGPLFGVNGTDTPQQWNGVAGSTSNWTNASGSVAVPNGKYMAYANNQVFISGVAAFPSTVYWSAIADPTNWDPASLTGAGSAQFDPNDGQAITGIGRVGPYVLVCKPRKLWVIADTANPTTRRISDNIGCVSHRSIATGSEGTYFLSEDRGVYITNGSKLTPISDKIQPAMDVVAGQRSQAAGAYYNGHYYLSVAGGGAPPNDTTYDYDATLQSWWRHTFGSNQFAVWHPSTTAGLYSAKSTSAKVDQCFVPGVTQDNGANFTWVWRGPWQSPTFYRRRRFPTPYFRKRLRQVRMEGQGTVDFSLAKDYAGAETLIASNILGTNTGGMFGGTGSFGGTGLFGDAATINRQRFYSLGVANVFSLVFGATSSTQDALYSYTLMVADRKDSVT